MNDLNNFISRYYDFWEYFNPGRSVPGGMAKLAKRYGNNLIAAKVTYHDFNRICEEIEHDLSELPFSFNLPAHVLDMLRIERDDAAMQQQQQDKRPIRLPIEGVAIDLDRSPHLRETVEKLRRSGLTNWLGLLERINARRIASNGEEEYSRKCAACNGTGFVGFYGFFDHVSGRKTGKLHEVTDRGGFEFVKRCVCSKGKRMAGDIWQATSD